MSDEWVGVGHIGMFRFQTEVGFFINHWVFEETAGRAVFLGAVALFQGAAPFTVPMIWSQILAGLPGLAIQAVLVPLVIIALRAVLVRDKA